MGKDVSEAVISKAVAFGIFARAEYYFVKPCAGIVVAYRAVARGDFFCSVVSGAANIFNIHRAVGRSAIVQNSCMKSKKRLILRKSTYIYYSPNTIFWPSTVTLYCELKSVI